MSPAESVDQAFLQLEFAIKLLVHIELGKINACDFDTDVLIKLKQVNLPFTSGTFVSGDEIILAAQNNYMLTLGFTTIVLDRALEDAGFERDDSSPAPYRDLRDLVYMIRCAFAHDMMRPRWEARGRFARQFCVHLPSGPLLVDTLALHGQRFDDSQLGGIEGYLQIKAEAQRLVLR